MYILRNTVQMLIWTSVLREKASRLQIIYNTGDTNETEMEANTESV